MLTFGQADIARTIGPTMLARGRIVHAQGQVNRCRRQRGPHRHRRAAVASCGPTASTLPPC